MCSFISSNDNRFYTAREAEFGKVPTVTSLNRIPAVRLTARQVAEKVTRRDKTGGRSFLGLPTGIRRQTSFALKTYLTSWSDQSAPPAYSPLFEASMGGVASVFDGGTVASIENSGRRLRLTGAHGLSVGQAVAVGGELRFVTTVVDAQAFDVNAPFGSYAGPGAVVSATVTYKLGTKLPSISIFDYWSPEEAIHRIILGAAINEFRIAVNGDFHEFEFKGPARDVIDSMSFVESQGGLASWPPEPMIETFDYSVIPGHLGQVWLGSAPDRFFSLTQAELRLDNGIETRRREFGTDGLCGIVAGERTASIDFEVYANESEATKALYQSARLRSPIQAMLQLGHQPGQLFGAYLKSVQLETPDFDDAEVRLRWKFSGCRAQGAADDELTIAFG